MSFEIRTPEGDIYAVHTEVGDGLARVVVQPIQQHQPVAVEPQDGDA